MVNVRKLVRPDTPPRRPATPKVRRALPTDPLRAMEHPVTIRLPEDLRDALNRATVDDGRPSASDMIRVILREYLRERDYFSNEALAQPDQPDLQHCTVLRKDGRPCKGVHRHPSGMCRLHRRIAAQGTADV